MSNETLRIARTRKSQQGRSLNQCRRTGFSDLPCTTVIRVGVNWLSLANRLRDKATQSPNCSWIHASRTGMAFCWVSCASPANWITAWSPIPEPGRTLRLW